MCSEMLPPPLTGIIGRPAEPGRTYDVSLCRWLARSCRDPPLRQGTCPVVRGRAAYLPPSVEGDGRIPCREGSYALLEPEKGSALAECPLHCLAERGRVPRGERRDVAERVPGEVEQATVPLIDLLVQANLPSLHCHSRPCFVKACLPSIAH